MWMQVDMLLIVFVDDCLCAPKVHKPNVSHKAFSQLKLDLLLGSFFDLLLVKRCKINLNKLSCSCTQYFEEEQTVFYLLNPKPLR